jgi:hypothetical protein
VIDSPRQAGAQIRAREPTDEMVSAGAEVLLVEIGQPGEGLWTYERAARLAFRAMTAVNLGRPPIRKFAPAEYPCVGLHSVVRSP